MTMQSPAILDDAAWEVPAHAAALYAPRAHRHALVIPVINEGERIRGQLRRIAAAGLAVDVVIADGGSTDGSLDADFMREVGVRAVLTKTGPGKLSAQLRMAYSWCLRQGYAGIVTIDGNGKDGVEAVAAMVARLEEGCDYVQGSRYLPGGAAENTPLERTIANRLIHAPMLSLAGRHWFTDTTNGFRAYSAAYLLHPDVQPFREVFSVYNLLFYLTVRAGQLGLKVADVSAVRRYPDDGKVPTKIGGFASKLALLKETFVAATGGYTPDAAVRRAGWLAPVAVLFALLGVLLAGVIAAPPYSPDSWALWELSQTVFGDFYRFTHWRSYASDLPYSASFPPLTPVLIAGIDAVLGIGPRTGLILAFAAFAGFALVSEAIARRVTGAAWLGLGAALVLLAGPNMLLIEMQAGRTIPLQLLLYALVLWGLVRGAAITLGQSAAIGFVAGLAVLGRFDAVLLPVPVALAIGWLTRSPAKGLAALAASAVAVSPWAAWSLATFGTPFATDNAGIAAALDPRAYVTDWWPTPQPTLADDPLAWAGKVGANLGRFAYIAAGLALSPLGLVAAAFLAFPAALAWLCRGEPHKHAALGVLAGFAVLMALMLAPQVLTGYVEQRYFSAAVWAGLLAAGCFGIAQSGALHQRAIFGRGAGLAALLAAVVLAATAPREQDAARFDKPADVTALKACLVGAPDARVLVLGDDNLAARAGAQGGIAAMMAPRNLAEGRLDPAGARAVAARFGVTHVLAADPARAGFVAATFPVTPVAGCPLALARLKP
ncbi:MAG: glycosyltransferase family 2 protein [Erythrobacter sp.]|uniref:glycosyltransferase family 2 protein n=1 Tax=Erythrobacter sp. TaxID=1042 RepID=UPI0025F43DB7|nr:glycosyltransferase family 2 protein [Erythrobacter sp.]MCL9997837.1 glycosyltransferase family 2 protein [Erythrobacter sp.]